MERFAKAGSDSAAPWNVPLLASGADLAQEKIIEDSCHFPNLASGVIDNASVATSDR